MTRSAMYLLGAGASAEADIPLASQLTRKLTEQINSGDGDSFGRAFATPVRALNFVIANILAHDGRRGSDPTVLPDIERVVSSVELLSKRADLEVAPFITAWDSTVDSLEHARPQPAPHRLGESLRSALVGTRDGGPGPNPTAVERLLAAAIDARTKPKREDVFHQLYDELVRGLIRLLIVGRDAVDYLRPLADSARSSPVQVATVNYDLTVETACSTAGVEWGHGVDGWDYTGLLRWSDDGMRLIKLHGSIDWQYEQNARLAIGVDPLANRNAALIFGRREKLRASGPFLQLLEYFRSALRGHTDLVVIGYSFADDHVNLLIDQWMAADGDRRILLVDPYFSLMPGFPIQPQLKYYKRFTAGAATRMAVIPESTGRFMQTLAGNDAVALVAEALNRTMG